MLRALELGRAVDKFGALHVEFGGIAHLIYSFQLSRGRDASSRELYGLLEPRNAP